jgi:hypothetical protein
MNSTYYYYSLQSIRSKYILYTIYYYPTTLLPYYYPITLLPDTYYRITTLLTRYPQTKTKQKQNKKGHLLKPFVRDKLRDSSAMQCLLPLFTVDITYRHLHMYPPEK